jgi:hypothetical protein
LDREIGLREKLQREKDTLYYECVSYKNQGENLKMDLNYMKEKCSKLEKDLKELDQHKDSTDTMQVQQFAKLKAQLRDLEQKYHEQEDELDEQASLIQHLEQNKLRLEMDLEKFKQKSQRDLAEKDAEMDELRFQSQKKLKSIELQLDEECEMSSQIQKDKRDLERKLREMENGKKLDVSLDFLLVLKLTRSEQVWSSTDIT